MSVTYSNVVFMEGNWVVMGVQCGGLLYCVTVYISVFDVCLLRTAMMCLWKERTDKLGCGEC